jgi:transcription initiation factor TFIIIB Brf1 subunit/transcription initiation factor TFIIB
MAQQFCPECGGVLFYDISMKRYLCKSCGLFVTRDEIFDLKDRDKRREEDVKKKKLHRNDEYLEWWLGKKKR